MWIAGIIINSLSVLCGLFMLWQLPRLKPLGSMQIQPGITDLREVSVIIPAYNEANRLPPLLASLMQQQTRPLEIIVVDDHSFDETAEIARSSGCRVITADPVEEGWVGKSRACWSGAKAARGSVLVFLDADTRLEHPIALASLFQAYARQASRGILSVQPYHRVRRLYESFSAMFNIIVLAGVNHFSILGDRISGSGSFGPCLVCSRDDYFRTGGHEAVHEAILDDLALGALFHQSGLPVTCIGGRGLIAFRMYPEGIGQLFEGWTKNFCTASSSTHPLILGMIILWIGGAFSTLPSVWRAAATGNNLAIYLSVLVSLAYMGVMMFQARRAGNFHWLLLILYPLLAVFFACLFVWSLYLTKVRRTVSWRGRKIKV